MQARRSCSRADVARAVRDLSLRYLRNELKIDDVTGGTFTSPIFRPTA